ncbi:MAG: DEAD/DEAH box helicase, partial [Methylococcales bacterium]|nr:DEAD/DEAH box helicase [Methylococcales bacterium]
MFLLHTHWLPPDNPKFHNSGQLVCWLETEPVSGKKKSKTQHPSHLSDKTQLLSFFGTLFKKKTMLELSFSDCVFHLKLPSNNNSPHPSPEMMRLTDSDVSDDWQWQLWQIQGMTVCNPLLFLKEINFVAHFFESEMQLAADTKFWIQFAQQLGQLIRQQQFIPSFKQHKNKSKNIQAYPCWEPLGLVYEELLNQYTLALPQICKMIYEKKSKEASSQKTTCLDAESLLRHFSEQVVEELTLNVKFTKKTFSIFQSEPLADCLQPPYTAPLTFEHESWNLWQRWHQRITGQSVQATFTLGIRLLEATKEEPDSWKLVFFITAQNDQSLQVTLCDYWEMKPNEQKNYRQLLGTKFESNLLISLGQAARICPLLWQGLEVEQPSVVNINQDMAVEFLKNDAIVLEQAGFLIQLPLWWTPKGRSQTRIRITSSASSKSSETKKEGAGYFSVDSLISYEYQLSVGGQVVTQEEWDFLVNAKSSLVNFRGEWVAIDQGKMQQLLDLWQDKTSQQSSVSVIELLKQVGESNNKTTEYVFDDELKSMMNGLHDPQSFTLLSSPKKLQGTLRSYQLRGMSWLSYMEACGLNPCLADDMGLGKTIQVIAHLLCEQAFASKNKTNHQTLLVAPTSVLGNWEKEIQKFAPSLSSMIHHGSQRSKTAASFKKKISKCNIIITAFSLVQRDISLFKTINWRRVVLDEAQNIKNPKSKQSKAVFSLTAQYRIAMTGTPIENRLMDLWSLFHFLNPGYLNNESQFKKQYETPIQRNSDMVRSKQLKKLVTPFILRRLKTDKSIIKDLPDKVEQKVYCNLTKEQASLYQAVVDDVQQQIETAEGMQRKGLILSTLLRLKQICN